MVEDRFDDVDLHHGEFPGVHWPNVDLSKGRLGRIDLGSATLPEADLTWADCNGMTCRNADLRGATLTDVTAAGADFVGATLAGATLDGGGLDHAAFADADITEADLTDAWLRGATLADADLAGASVAGAYLEGASLAGADLRAVDLRDATLRDADLTGVDLTDASLAGTNLDGTDLTGVTVDEATLAGTRNLDRATLPDGIEPPARDTPPEGERRGAPRADSDGRLPDGTPVGERAVSLLVEHGYGPREDITGCTAAEIDQLEADCGVDLPAAYRSCLASLGRSANGFQRGVEFYYPHVPSQQAYASETADSWDDFTFEYADADFVFLGVQGYSFLFFSTREGPDPPVFSHMENEGPHKRADAFSAWLFETIRD